MNQDNDYLLRLKKAAMEARDELKYQDEAARRKDHAFYETPPRLSRLLQRLDELVPPNP